MATLLPSQQVFVDLRNGWQVGIHVLTIMSSSDTFKVPRLGQRSTLSVSAEQIRREGDTSAVTVTDDATTQTNAFNTVTLTGGAAEETILICTVHDKTIVNSSVLDQG